MHITEVEVRLHPFLSSALDGGERLNSHTGRFNHGEEPRHPANNRRLVGARRRSGRFGQDKNLCPPTEIRTPDVPAHTLVTANTLLRLLGKYVSQNKDSAY